MLWLAGRVRLVRSRRLELPRVAPQRPQRCASTNSATTARGEARQVANAGHFVKCGFGPSGAPGHVVVDVRLSRHLDGDALVVDLDLATGHRVVVGQDPDLL